MSKVKLSQLGTFKNGLNFTAKDTTGGCRIIGIPDFADNYIAPSKGLKEINPDVVSSDLFLEPSDILFVRSNGNKALVGRTMLVETVDSPTTFSGFCIRFRPYTERVNPLYMLYLFKSPQFRKRFSSTQQTSINNLNQDVLANIEINLPPMETQVHIAECLHSVTKKIICNKSINDNLAA